jgi:hypothetical protein
MKSKKGGAFEREICKRLSLWWSGGKDDSLLWRTSGSGARATGRGNKRTTNAYGDITSTSKKSEPLIDLITFELKRGYNKLSLQDLLDLPSGKKGAVGSGSWKGWLEKANYDNSQAGGFSWLMIVKRDSRVPLVIMPGYLYDALVGEGAFSCFDSQGQHYARLQFYLDGYNWILHCTPLDCFLSSVTPQHILSLSRKV